MSTKTSWDLTIYDANMNKNETLNPASLQITVKDDDTLSGSLSVPSVSEPCDDGDITSLNGRQVSTSAAGAYLTTASALTGGSNEMSVKAMAFVSLSAVPELGIIGELQMSVEGGAVQDYYFVGYLGT